MKKKILHLISGDGESVQLAERVMASQKVLPEVEVSVIRMGDEPVDYGAMLRSIFEADSVQVW